MEFIKELFSNHMFVCSLISYFAAQIIKIIINLVNTKKLDMSLILSSGGMPSSHASTVASLAFSALRIYGPGSPYFAITFVLASVVMYDATGVRRATGEHAKILNRLLADMTSGDPVLAEASLKELIGHTPVQVVMGALLGIAIPFIVPLA